MAVWIDTDPAVGEPDRDVDDGFALIQAFHTDMLNVTGVSAVFGNTPLVRTWPITHDIVERFGPSGMRPSRGAAGPHERSAPTEASEALAAALREQRLTIAALGPLTNVASVLQRYPELVSQVIRVVAVAGRRPGQRFTTGTTNPRGHRDLNFELDVEAFRALLESGVPLTLAPFELSSKVWITESDLVRMSAGSPGARYLAEASRAWLRLWQRTFGVDGFNPFDTLAVDVIGSPGQFTCDEGTVAIERGPDDETEASMQGTTSGEKSYLVFRARDGADAAAPAGPSGRAVTYCHTPDEGFKERLLTTLMR